MSRTPATGRLLALTAVLAAAALVCGFAAGRATSGMGAVGSWGAVRTIAGVQVGVLHTRAGALAAADNYAAQAAETVVQDPERFARLVAQAYAPAARAGALAQAHQEQLSDAADVANYGQGGRTLALVAARRLDGYTGALAQVTTWLCGVSWGPQLAPRQAWTVLRTRLVWHVDRWQVSALDTLPVPAPSPAVVIVDGADDQTPVFTAGLVGMSEPIYGTP
jgi:hypothetical protein